MTTLTQQTPVAPSPRVESSNSTYVLPLRVSNGRIPNFPTPNKHQYSVQILHQQQHSRQPQNIHFNNLLPQIYPHCSTSQRKSTNFRYKASQELIVQHLFTFHVSHIYRADRKKETLDSLMNVSTKHIWATILSNEWGCLSQGNIYGVRSTDTIEFINRSLVPHGRDVTYDTFVLDV